MKNSKRVPKAAAENVIHGPAFPIDGGALLHRLATAVAAARGYPLTGSDIAVTTGQAETTISHWRRSGHLPHLVAWCCLLEQLPAEERHRFVDGLCRELPTLQHPWLAHDPVAVTKLTALLAKPRGLTLISGGDPRQRTFLLAALGHTSTRLDLRHRRPSGIDMEEPTWFVPVPSVHYLPNALPSEQVRRIIANLWPEVRDSDARLVLLNGVWSTAPALRHDIRKHASRCHVMLADESPSQEPFSGITSDVTHLIEVAASPENRLWIRATIKKG